MNLILHFNIAAATYIYIYIADSACMKKKENKSSIIYTFKHTIFDLIVLYVFSDSPTNNSVCTSHLLCSFCIGEPMLLCRDQQRRMHAVFSVIFVRLLQLNGINGRTYKIIHALLQQFYVNIRTVS